MSLQTCNCLRTFRCIQFGRFVQTAFDSLNTAAIIRANSMHISVNTQGQNHSTDICTNCSGLNICVSECELQLNNIIGVDVPIARETDKLPLTLHAPRNTTYPPHSSILFFSAWNRRHLDITVLLPLLSFLPPQPLAFLPCPSLSHSFVGVAQRLERQSLAGGLYLIYAWSMVDMWPLYG